MALLAQTFGVFTNQYFGIIGFFVILALPYFLRSMNTADRQTAVTMAGMLGTFLGIVGGLYLFDSNNIDASVPALLGGLKTAFLTSIAGLTASLVLQIKPEIYRSFSQVVEEEKSEQEILAEVLTELKALNKNIVGDEDSTLLTQLQKLRTGLIDKHDELKKSFDEFAEKMVENNSKALIEALENVIKDFNTKINEQFGENFKQLNEGVGKMLEWQENYTRQVENAVEILNTSKEAMSNSAELLESASKNAEEFRHLAEELKAQLEAAGTTMVGLKSLGETLAGSGQTIRDEMEQITKQNLQTLGSNLASISEKMVEDFSHLQRMINRMRNAK